MNREAMFSSATDMWATPMSLFEKLDKAFGFTLDVCAVKENAKCANFFSPEDDGLKHPWEGRCWMNPPYGRNIGEWMRKAYESSQEGALVVCLVPARTDTAWWHEYAIKGDVHHIRGRIKFGNAKSAAPFPSAIVVFWPKP